MLARYGFCAILVGALLSAPASTVANPLQFNLLLPAVSGPPYPTAVAGWSLNTGTGGLPAVQRGTLRTRIQAMLGDGSVLPADMQPGPAGTPATQAFLNLSAEEFKNLLQAEVDLFGQSDFGLLLPAVIQGFSWGESSFQVMFDTAMGDGSVNRFVLGGEVMQDFHFNQVSAVLADGSVRVAFDVEPVTGGIRAAFLPSEVVQMTLTGEVVPEPTTMALLAVATPLVLRRRASW